MSHLVTPFAVSGYVLAGGKSSRMGQDKALLELAGKTLVGHAVHKLQRVCGEVSVLGAQAALAEYAPIVPDLHPDCGPLGGIEAALTHARHEWSLVLPVDVPFLPLHLLETWIDATLLDADRVGARLSLHVVDGRPQPALLLLHRDLLGAIAAALARGERKVMPVLLRAAKDMAGGRRLAVDDVLRLCRWGNLAPGVPAPNAVTVSAWGPMASTSVDWRLYFANLNTPKDFAEAERNLFLLDTAG